MNLKPIVAIIACGLVTAAVTAYGHASPAKPVSRCILHMRDSDKLSLGNSYLTDTSCDWFNSVGISIDSELYWENHASNPKIQMQKVVVGASGANHNWNTTTVAAPGVNPSAYGINIASIAEAYTSDHGVDNGKAFGFNNINVGINTNINDKIMAHIGIDANGGDSGNVNVDEAFAVWDLGRFNLKFGRTFSHFGKYDAYRNNPGLIQQWTQFTTTGIELSAEVGKHAYAYAFSYGRSTRADGFTNTTSRFGNWGGGIDYSMKRGRFNVGFDASIIGDASNLDHSAYR